jgi:hypothetical protein
MLLAPAPGALCLGFALANCGAWLIAPARRAFDEEAVGYDGTGFAEATSRLFRRAAWMLLPGLVAALVAAFLLRSLR